jgi:hypothetical protein
MDFTITLSSSDWDVTRGGWRCPALQIPGTTLQSVYVDGVAVDTKLYEVNPDMALIRWSGATHPGQAVVHLKAEKTLSTEELTLRWRKLAILLPVIGTLLTALVAGAIHFLDAPASSAPGSAVGIVKLFERSNDFLATGDQNQFPSMLKKAKREAWFVGTTFYISADQYHDVILSRLADGVDLNFLVLSPVGDGVGKVAHLLGVTEKELSADCASGIRILARTAKEAQAANYPGTLRVKIVDEPIQTRLYMFDPKADEGYLYFIPQLNGTNSQILPGFLVRNSTASYHSVYFNGVLKMWNDPAAQTLDAWSAAHPEMQ